MSELACYESYQVPYVWDKVKNHIQAALDRGSNYTIDDIYVGLCKKEMQLWVWRSQRCRPTIHAALITTIQIKNDVKFCLFLAIGGTKMDEWFKYINIVEEWAKSEGCEEMRIYGRPGWAKKTGYEIEYVKMVKRL